MSILWVQGRRSRPPKLLVERSKRGQDVPVLCLFVGPGRPAARNVTLAGATPQEETIRARPVDVSPDNSRTPGRNTRMSLRDECLLHRDDLTPRHTLFPREIFRRDEEDRRRRCRGHRRGGLTTYPAEKIRGTAGVVRELCGLARSERAPVGFSALHHEEDLFRRVDIGKRVAGNGNDVGFPFSSVRMRIERLVWARAWCSTCQTP